MFNKALLVLFALCCSTFSFSQTIYETYESKKLNSVRKLKIKLPKDYDENSSRLHPVVIVFDGDYLFEPVSGQIDFQTYFDDMPSSIVVGIMHEDNRFYDTYHDEVTGLPQEFGAHFYEFVAMELLPHLDRTYNTSNFKVAVGHNKTANLMNAFMLKDVPVFQAYVNLSPDYVGNMSENISSRASWAKNDIIYYLAMAKNDVRQIRASVTETNLRLKDLENPKFTYYFDEFEEASHYTMVTRGVARAFDKIFDIYRPIRDKEIREKILTYEGTLDTYIKNRYKRIEELFGIEKPITEEEFQKMVDAADQRQDLESLFKIGKMVHQYFPKSSLGTYYLALHAEKSGKTKKAKKLYQTALALENGTLINRDFIMSKVEGLEMTEIDND